MTPSLEPALQDDRSFVFTNGSLQLSAVRGGDGGVYKCVARNAHSNGSITAVLEVRGTRTPPPGKLGTPPPHKYVGPPLKMDPPLPKMGTPPPLSAPKWSHGAITSHDSSMEPPITPPIPQRHRVVTPCNYTHRPPV